LKTYYGASMSITVVNTLPENDWRQFVMSNPAGNIFHTPEMFQVFSRTKGYRPELWAATENKRVLALFLPVQITLMNGVMRYFTTRSVAFGSVLCAPEAEGYQALARLLQTYVRDLDRAPLFTELRNLSDMKALQGVLSKHGFIYEDYLNYLIELGLPSEDLLQNIGRRTRKHIRRGMRQGKIVVEEAKDSAQVAVCYDLLCRTYKAAQLPLAHRSLFEAAYDLLWPKNMVRFSLARLEATPVAVSIDLLYKDIVYGWYGGLDRAFSSYFPNELLHWHILEWGAENGYAVYDFGGAGKPDEEYGVRDFKAKFGGELVCYGRNVHVHSSRTLWLSELGYRLLRKWL
jgi:serine/alanine adding enzyme